MQEFQIIGLTVTDLKQIISEIIREELKQICPTQISPVEFLTRAETALLLKISLTTLDVWSRKGVIPAHKISNNVRFKRSEIESVLKKMETLKYRKG